MRRRRSTARDDRKTWWIYLLDRYGRSIERASFHGSAQAAKRRAISLLRSALDDHVVYGVRVAKEGS